MVRRDIMTPAVWTDDVVAVDDNEALIARMQLDESEVNSPCAT